MGQPAGSSRISCPAGSRESERSDSLLPAGQVLRLLPADSAASAHVLLHNICCGCTVRVDRESVRSQCLLAHCSVLHECCQQAKLHWR